MEDIFCASQSSTAISCSIMDQASSSSCSNTIQLGGRAIDRHNPIITDSRRTPSRDFTASSSSPKPPIDPKPCQDLQEAKKKSSFSKPSDKNKRIATKSHHDRKKKSVAEKLTEHITNIYTCTPIDSILRKSWVRPPADLVTPAGSSRYLLSDTVSSLGGGVSDNDPVLALTKVDGKKAQIVHQDDINHASKPSSSSAPKSGSSDQVSYLSKVDDEKAQVVHQDEINHASKPSSSSAPKSSSSDQVVVLRVSIHCKGCEGKVRKHLSRMQGVTSFNIDSAAKKVTVVGDVTPLSVLASISKVKTARTWPPSASAFGSVTAEARNKNLI